MRSGELRICTFAYLPICTLLYPLVSYMSNKKLHRAWSMYDWANSAYNLVITSTIFPAYYLAVTTLKDGDTTLSDQVSFFGLTVTNSVLSEYAIAFAYLVIAFLSPILSSIADYKGNKKSFMRLFCYVGSLACAGLYFFTADTLELHWYCTGYALALLRMVSEASGGEEEEMKLMQVLSQKRYNPFAFS